MTYQTGVCQSQSHYGKEFYFGVFNSYSGGCTEILVDIASAATGKYNISVSSLSTPKTGFIYKGNLTTIKLPCTISNSGTLKGVRAIYLKTNVEVAVYATYYHSDSAESYLVLPLKQLGNSYCTAGYTPLSGEESYVMVAASQDGTLVSVYDNSTGNLLRSVTINKLYLSQFSITNNLKGITVVSDKPTSVITGTSCVRIPVGTNACDIIIEQMIPTDVLDSIYIVPPTPPKEAYELRVTNLNRVNKTICFHNQTQSYCGDDSSITLRMGTAPTVIVASEPVAVFQYGYGNDYPMTGIGDPFMTVIPGLGQFLNQYYFAIPNVFKDAQNYISIIIKTNNILGLTLDGSNLTNTKMFNVSKPLQNHTVLILNMSSGYHMLQHSDHNVKFGLLVYGLGAKRDTFVGYGYPGGMKLSKFDTSATVSYNSSMTTASVSFNSSMTTANVTYNSSMTTANVTYNSNMTTANVSNNSSMTTANVSYNSSMTTATVTYNSSSSIPLLNMYSPTDASYHLSNQSTEDDTSTSTKQNSLGIVLGTVLGTTAALSSLLCILYLIWRKKRKSEVEPERTDNREELTEDENNDTNVEGNGTT